MNLTLRTRDAMPWHRKIVWFLTGQSISQIGSSLVQFSLIWYVNMTTETATATAMTILIVVSYVPQLLIATIAGVWADRFSKKWLMALSDGGIALVTTIIAILFIMGKQSIWHIYIISAIRSLGGGIQGPAVTAAIPELVPRAHLTRVNSLQSTIGNLTQLMAPILGALALAILPMFAVLLLDVITATIGIAILISIPFPKRYEQYARAAEEAMRTTVAVEVESFSKLTPEPREDTNDSSWAHLKEGFSYIRNHRLIFVLLSIYAGFMVLLAPTILLFPVYLKQKFGTEPWRISVVQTSLFCGMVAGGLFVSWIGRFKYKIRVIQIAGSAIALTIIALGFLAAFRSPLMAVLGGIFFIAGVIVPFYTTNVTTLLQEETPPDRHGRIFAVLFMAGSAAIPIGSLLFGPLADIVPIESIIFVTGLLQLFLVYMSTKLVPSRYVTKVSEAAVSIESSHTKREDPRT